MVGMTGKRILHDTDAIGDLAEILKALPSVNKLDTKEEPQSWALAYTFGELEMSFRKFTDELLPRLVESTRKPEETKVILDDIGDEFRHILYHMYDSGYYAYLRELSPRGDSEA